MLQNYDDKPITIQLSGGIQRELSLPTKGDLCIDVAPFNLNVLHEIVQNEFIVEFTISIGMDDEDDGFDDYAVGLIVEDYELQDYT